MIRNVAGIELNTFKIIQTINKKGYNRMSTSYERTFQAEVLKECLAGVAGKLFRLNTKKGKELSFEKTIKDFMEN